MEMKSPCPATVTVRRNPPRKARATPSSAIPLSKPLSSPSLSRDIFSTDILQNPNKTDDGSTDSSTTVLSENLKVFLRIRPLTVQKNSRNIAESKNVWPKNPKIKGNSRPKIKKSCEICVQVNEDMHSVTVSTPQQLQEMKRIKSEIYEGFSNVFASGASQTDVYEEMVKPLVEDFLKGKSGMLAAMGPSGSGKTHTVFGCAREPGMVPLAIRRIFSKNESIATHTSRVFYLSMFEISSEKGKAERLTDLLHDRGDISMQQSVIKGLQKVVVSDAQQAESLIAHGMLRRATAMTNSNSQSSRSQCIINIQRDSTKGDEVNASSATLTIVDLAGAEREKKTGNQGARLLESNFINNTSMVFGQCLRSLLEHQRNRSKPLPKHYKNSLLTRYLRDYLEGNKRMALILTVKPGVEDYLDTSFLLRQTSPFTRIKFKTVEEPVHLAFNKRPNQALPQAGQLKKMKFSNNKVSLIDEENIDRGPDLDMRKEITRKVTKGCLNQNIDDTHDENINEVHVLSNRFIGPWIREKLPLKEDNVNPNLRKDREYQIMQGLSKAMWAVLKQYKEKFAEVEMENCRLRDSLDNEKTRSLGLENELAKEKTRLFHLKNELKELKLQYTCGKASANVLPVSMLDTSFDFLEESSEILSYSSRELEKSENEKKIDPCARESILTPASCSTGPEAHRTQQLEEPVQSSNDTENTKGLKDTSEVDICSRSSQVLSTSICSSQDLIRREDTSKEDIPTVSQATSQSTSGSLYTCHRTEQDVVTKVEDVKNMDQETKFVPNGPCFATYLECESIQITQDYEDLTDAKQESPTQLNMPISGLTNGSFCTNHKSEQDSVNLVREVKNMEPESESSSNGFDTFLECEESAKGTQDSEDIKDAKLEPAQFENGTTAHSGTAINSSEYPSKDDMCYHVDEEQCNGEESKQEPLVVTALLEEGSDAKKVHKFVPKVAPCSNVQLTGKPKRRLQPASSVLLKDISFLSIKDENDKPKGGRVGKRGTMEDKNRTQGSLSLLNLLTK